MFLQKKSSEMLKTIRGKKQRVRQKKSTETTRKTIKDQKQRVRLIFPHNAINLRIAKRYADKISDENNGITAVTIGYNSDRSKMIQSLKTAIQNYAARDDIDVDMIVIEGNFGHGSTKNTSVAVENVRSITSQHLMYHHEVHYITTTKECKEKLINEYQVKPEYIHERFDRNLFELLNRKPTHTTPRNRLRASNNEIGTFTPRPSLNGSSSSSQT